MMGTLVLREVKEHTAKKILFTFNLRPVSCGNIFLIRSEYGNLRAVASKIYTFRPNTEKYGAKKAQYLGKFNTDLKVKIVRLRSSPPKVFLKKGYFKQTSWEETLVEVFYQKSLKSDFCSFTIKGTPSRPPSRKS